MDLCGVSFIDCGAGKTLLKEIHQQGGKLIAQGCLNEAIVEEISGRSWGRLAAGTVRKARTLFFMQPFFQLAGDSSDWTCAGDFEAEPATR